MTTSCGLLQLGGRMCLAKPPGSHGWLGRGAPGAGEDFTALLADELGDEALELLREGRDRRPGSVRDRMGRSKRSGLWTPGTSPIDMTCIWQSQGAFG